MSEVSQDQYSYSLIVVEKASEIEVSTLVDSTRSCVLNDHGNDGVRELNKNLSLIHISEPTRRS